METTGWSSSKAKTNTSTVPSPNKGGGFLGQISNLPRLKENDTHRTETLPRNSTETKKMAHEKNGNELEEAKVT